MTELAYYVGVDQREPDALTVTVNSAKEFVGNDVPIHELEHDALRKRQLFDRPWRIAEDGGYWDERDGKPFSTQFSHTRFLTPQIALADGYREWALFTDCDWLWLADPRGMLKEADPSKTVMVVPHKFEPSKPVKMDNRPQIRYNRKLWSALMLWNLKSKKLPTVEMVNSADGGYMHRFEWLEDEDIGFLSEAWHWVPNYSPTTDAALAVQANNKHTPINGVHFTYGPPSDNMIQREITPFDKFWRDSLIDFTRNRF